MSKLYECEGCRAYCCTVYERVQITERDAKRLASHLRIKPGAFFRKYTFGDRLLARKDDTPEGKACVFLDTDTRRCTVYEARPDICRSWPHHAAPGAEGRCAYYDLAYLARKESGPLVVPLVQIARLVRE